MSTLNTITGGQLTPEDANLALVPGDGGPEPYAKGKPHERDEELEKFKAEIAQISKDAAYSVNERRFAAEETRFCIWEGQSPDGRKHSESMNGAEPFPFEGASDGRIRLADGAVNERVLLLVTSAMMSLPKVKGLELRNEALGARIQTLLKWVLENKLCGEYFRELYKLANFQTADSPAGAVLGVFWLQEWSLRMRTMTLAQIAQVLVAPPPQGYGLQPSELQPLQLMLADPARDKESAEFLQQLVPDLKADRAREAVKSLREGGTAAWPEKYLKENRPTLKALRLFDDVFFPANTTDPQKCRCWFWREWLPEWEVRERTHSMGWSEAFAKEVLKHEGQTGFPLYKRDPIQGDFAVARQESKETFRGLYEVITCFYRAVNDDNVPAIYCKTFHHALDFCAKARELCDYDHGKYPFVYFSHEVLSQRLWDSRGIPELTATDQAALKLLHDSFADNVSLSTVPPVMVPDRRPNLRVTIGPLKLIKEKRPGEVRFMETPAYPLGNEKQQEAIQKRVDQYLGRLSELVLPQLQQLIARGATTWFLENLREALTMVIQLCQQYLTPEDLQLITGADNVPIARTLEEIQGRYQLQLSFNPSALNLDYLKVVFELISKYIIPIDRQNTLQTDRMVRSMLSWVDAGLADDWLVPVQQAQAREVKEEQDNFAQISAGVEPPMVAEGLNFPLRLQVLTGIGQKNPEAIQKLSPNSRKIYDARLKYLENQVQQQKNAQIGRQVGQPALGQEPNVPAGLMGANQGNGNGA